MLHRLQFRSEALLADELVLKLVRVVECPQPVRFATDLDREVTAHLWVRLARWHNSLQYVCESTAYVPTVCDPCNPTANSVGCAVVCGMVWALVQLYGWTGQGAY